MNFLRGFLSLAVVLAMAGVGALFALQNEVAVPLDVLLYQFAPRSVALWVLAAFACGGLFGMLLTSIMVLRLRTRLRLISRQLGKAQMEIDRLRSQEILAED